MIDRAARVVAVTLLCAVTLLFGAAPAFAHTRLQSSDPADGSSLGAGPQRVSLTFNEPMQTGFATLTVIGPDGRPYQSGEVTANGGTVSIGVAPLGPAGRYEIGYRVVSEDGHPVTGSVAFPAELGPGRTGERDPGPDVRGARSGRGQHQRGRRHAGLAVDRRRGGADRRGCGRRAAPGPELTRR
jgi:methionine-rich copper-binding protein CopC